MAFGWASAVHVPTVFDRWSTADTLGQTLVSWGIVYQSLVFCIGVVLLFSKERGRRRGKLDWTRRWGVICSYVVFLLHAAGVLFIAALVLTGIAAVFQSIPLKYQPHVTPLFVEMGTGYLRFGAQPGNISSVVAVAFSSIAILLASVPLFDALRSTGPKRLAAVILAPLALFSLMHLAQAGAYCLGFSGISDISCHEAYFWPQPLVQYIGGLPTGWGWPPRSVSLGEIAVEAAKWLIILAIAIRLTIAQLAAWRKAKKPSPHNPLAPPLAPERQADRET
jgi:hypothetical protein